MGDAATLQRRATGAVSAVRATGAGVATAAAQKHAEGWNLVVARLEEGGDLDGACRVLEAALADDALLVVVAQPPLDEANRLARQKRLATDPRASTVWTAEREKACAAALQAASYAAVVVIVAAANSGVFRCLFLERLVRHAGTDRGAEMGLSVGARCASFALVTRLVRALSRREGLPFSSRGSRARPWANVWRFNRFNKRVAQSGNLA